MPTVSIYVPEMMLQKAEAEAKENKISLSKALLGVKPLLNQTDMLVTKLNRIEEKLDDLLEWKASCFSGVPGGGQVELDPKVKSVSDLTEENLDAFSAYEEAEIKAANERLKKKREAAKERPKNLIKDPKDVKFTGGYSKSKQLGKK